MLVHTTSRLHNTEQIPFAEAYERIAVATKSARPGFATEHERNVRAAWIANDSECFSRLAVAQQHASLDADLCLLKGLLAARAARGGSDKLNVLVLDIKHGSGHRVMSNTLLDLGRTALADVARFARVDFFGKDDVPYERQFDERMSNERGLILAATRYRKAYREWRHYLSTDGLKEIESILVSAMSERLMKSLDIVISAQPYGIAGLERVVNGVFGAQLRVMPTDFGLADWLSMLPKHDPHDLSVRFDLPVNDPLLLKQLRAKNQRNFSVVGLQAAPEFGSLGVRLRDQARRATARSELAATLRDLSNGTFAPGDKAIPIILGGKGIRAKRYLNYVEAILMSAEKLVAGTQKLHVFLVGVRGEGVPRRLEYGISTGVSQLVKAHAKARKSVTIHTLTRLSRDRIACLMAENVSIVKAGGLTTLELTAIGAKALVSMHLSKKLLWERFNAEFLEKTQLGFLLPTSEAKERQAVADKIRQAWDAPTTPLARHDFYKLYPKILANDAIARLQSLA